MLLASVASFIGALVLLSVPYVKLTEARAYDFCFRVAHWYGGHGETAPEIGFVSIDDRSVNPDSSPYSSKYGDDGWRTRDVWDLHVKQMGQIYLPKVLACDILFGGVATQPPPKDWKRVPGLRELEMNGNQGSFSIP